VFARNPKNRKVFLWANTVRPYKMRLNQRLPSANENHIHMNKRQFRAAAFWFI